MSAAPRERIVQFGERRRLTGTLTEALGDASGEIGFVLLNAGVISRVGPQRLNVMLARALARAGHAALRFDLSGLGESRAAAGNESWESQAVLDVREALSAFEREARVRRFVLIGLCSGADNGYAAALADERVAGLVLLDPYAFATGRSRWRALLLRLRRPGRMAAIVRGASRAVRRITSQLRLREAEGPGDDQRATPTAAAFKAGLETLVQRGVAVYLMYSGSVTHVYNDDAQFARVFGRALASRVRAEFLPQVNHTYTEVAAQRELVRRVLDWAQTSFAEPPR